MTVARLRFDNLRAPGDGLKLAGGGRGTAGFVLRPPGRALSDQRAAPGCSPQKEELDAHVRAELAAYKAPRMWVFVEEFPMTPSGKIQKFVLRDRFVAGELPPA